MYIEYKETTILYNVRMTLGIQFDNSMSAMI